MLLLILNIKHCVAFHHSVLGTLTQHCIREQMVTGIHRYLILKCSSMLARATVYTLTPDNGQEWACHFGFLFLEGGLYWCSCKCTNWSFSFYFHLWNPCVLSCVSYTSRTLSSPLSLSWTWTSAFSNWLMFVQISSAFSVLKFASLSPNVKHHRRVCWTYPFCSNANTFGHKHTFSLTLFFFQLFSTRYLMKHVEILSLKLTILNTLDILFHRYNSIPYSLCPLLFQWTTLVLLSGWYQSL